MLQSFLLECGACPSPRNLIRLWIGGNLTLIFGREIEDWVFAIFGIPLQASEVFTFNLSLLPLLHLSTSVVLVLRKDSCM